MTYALTIDNGDTETTSEFATLDQARSAWRAASKKVDGGELFSATVRDDEGKRILHWEQED